jgi:hypothetical protein
MQSLNISSEALSKESNSVISFKIPTIEDLDAKIVHQNPQLSLSDRIYQDLAEDSDNLFKNICLHDNLEANFQAIALSKLSGKSLTEIAAEFNLDVEKLSNFFQDCCCYYANVFEQEF